MDFQQSNLYTQLAVSQERADYSLHTLHRKILVQEVFQDLRSNATLIRQINCETIYDYPKEVLPALENASQINHIGGNSGWLRITKFQGNSLNHHVNTNFENCKSDTHEKIIAITDAYKETPMEIDSSSDQLISNSNNFQERPLHMDSSSDQLISYTNKFRKRKRKRSIDKNTSNNEIDSTFVPINETVISRFSTTLLILTVLLTLCGVYVIITGERFTYVNKKFQLENIKKELQEQVLHQEDAVKIIIKNFEQMDLWKEGVKVLPFIGSTGVGKTFTVNIIKNHFSPLLVHELDSNQLINAEKWESVITNLRCCGCNLIIVDNLKASDLSNFIHFAKELPKSNVLVIIPIFNIQDTDDGLIYEIKEDDFKVIRNEFEGSEMHYELVLFDMLKSYVIEEWLRKELHRQQINENRHDSLVKFLLNNNHVKYKGFKGLNSKLLLALALGDN